MKTIVFKNGIWPQKIAVAKSHRFGDIMNGNKKRIMFVCHGNICRSPMAEFIFKMMISERGLADEFEIRSCATSSEEIWRGVGNPIYPPAARELERRGVPYTSRRAVQLTCEDYDKYDMFIGMDSANVRNMQRIFGGDGEKKIYKLMEFTSRGGDVADPWYSDRFDIAFDDIYSGCRALMESLLGY